MSLPLITEVDEMLALLRANPLRMVEQGFDDIRIKEHDGRTLAFIDEDSPAYRLCDAAYDADIKRDAEAWGKLPLRYGPNCSSWLLAESPLAPQKCPGEDE